MTKAKNNKIPYKDFFNLFTPKLNGTLLKDGADFIVLFPSGSPWNICFSDPDENFGRKVVEKWIFLNHFWPDLVGVRACQASYAD